MHPVLFEIFNYPFYIYSLMITLGCVAGIWLVVRYGKQVGMSQVLLLDLCWWLILGGYLGARVIFMIVNWEDHWYPCVDYEYYNSIRPEAHLESADCWPLMAVWSGGLVFYGAFLGGILVLWWFTKRHKLRLLPLADALMPAFTIGQFFGRLGCLAAGCCWGKVTTLPWGIEFPRGSMVFRQHVEQHLIQVQSPHALPIHPTQLYDSLYGLGLFVALTWIRRHKRYHGQVFMWWLFLYPLMRSLVELFRGDSERGFITRVVYEPLNQLLGLPAGSTTFLSTSQFISLAVVVCSGIGLLVIRNRLNRLERAQS
jgi:phosphatidylglycerol:prolipoprotein diacylglycerol transferase